MAIGFSVHLNSSMEPFTTDLVESNHKLERLNEAQRKLRSVNPQCLPEIYKVLRKKQTDQKLQCRIGLASKLKEIILTGIQKNYEFQSFTNNNKEKLIENEKVTDCLKKKLSVLKLKQNSDQKYIDLIEEFL